MDNKTWTVFIIMASVIIYCVVMGISSQYKPAETASHYTLPSTIDHQPQQQQPAMHNISSENHRILVPGLVEVVPWEPFDITREVHNGDYQEAFYRLINRLDLECFDRIRMGKIIDGGWDVCLSGPYEPKNHSCLIYSFGINNDFSFDDDITKRYHCKLRAFDPTMEIQVEQNRSEHITFYPVGLSGEDGILKISGKPHNVSTLATLRKQFGEESTVIDYMKMDIEGSEWSAFESMISDGFLQKYVKQMGIELHSWATEYDRQLEIETRLESLGFRKWLNHWNMYCKSEVGANHLEISTCLEVYFLNINFLHNQGV